MKKLLALTLTLASFGFFGFGSETTAKANTVTAATPQTQIYTPQNRRWRNRNWRNRVRTVRTMRIVRHGYRTYRETYLVRYLPNGRTSTTLISRERIS